MKEYLALISSVGFLVGGAIAWTLALIRGYRNRTRLTQDEVDKVALKAREAQETLISVIREEAVAWKQRYVSEHEEFVTYRNKVHENNQHSNVTILRLTTENAELHAKTDLTPVLKFHADQNTINQKVVNSLDLLLQKLVPIQHEG